MASSSKPIGMQVSLVLFVLATLVCGVMWFLTNKWYGEREAELNSANTKAKESEATARTALERIDELKKVIGHPFDEVGEKDRTKPNTVLNAADGEIASVGPDLAQKTYSAAIAKLVNDVRTLTSERDDLRAKLDAEHREYIALEDLYKGRLNEQSSSRGRAESDLADANKSKDEEIAKKDADIDELKKAYTETQVAFDQFKEQADKDSKDYKQRIANLTTNLQKVYEELENVKRTSFEVPDGLVRWVDNVNHSVWINLGEADNLKARTTFSVYKQSNTGVARGSEDIKGSIEVTRIIGPHMAEARILKDDLYNPMAAGDPIYTPLWSPGRSEEFAFIGLADVDGDGLSKDRDILHEIVATVGAKFISEVDENGERTGGPITERTKFLVLGTIPDLSSAAVEEERKKIQQIYEQLKVMRQEAREHGVRIISLSDFLNYVGYKQQRRLFRPGGEAPYTLKSGSHSASTSETIGRNRVSAGKTADVYSGDRKLRPRSAAGATTSKLFQQGGR